MFTNELDVEGVSLTPYLEKGSDAFQLSGNQSKSCKVGVLMFYLGIDIGKRTHVASIMNSDSNLMLHELTFIYLVFDYIQFISVHSKRT